MGNCACAEYRKISEINDNFQVNLAHHLTGNYTTVKVQMSVTYSVLTTHNNGLIRCLLKTSDLKMALLIFGPYFLL